MRRYAFDAFGLDHLRLVDAPAPRPAPGEVRLAVQALSLNYRDLTVIEGTYHPRLPLPATPISDGAGVVDAVGDDVEHVKPGARVMGHFISGWLDGPYLGEYRSTTLGAPGPGLAAEHVVLKASAVVPFPSGYDAQQAATLPIAALTAWSALVTEGDLKPGETVLTLGTGGVSIFALQLAKAMGARVIITSSSDKKLERARTLGADHTINYRQAPDWEKEVLAATEGRGADLVLETAGIATFNQSIRCTRPGGVLALIGSVTGLEGPVNLARIFMNRIRVAGLLVDSRAAFLDLVRFLEAHPIRPVIDTVFPFERLPEALRYLKDGRHFGKIVVTV